MQQQATNITLEDIRKEQFYARQVMEKCALNEALILALQKANEELRERNETIKGLNETNVAKDETIAELNEMIKTMREAAKAAKREAKK